MIRQPPNGDPFLVHLVAQVNAELVRREPTIVGWRNDGTHLHFRFRAASSTPWVRVHVQSTVAGEGGLGYDASHYTSSIEVDCRGDRLQDVSVTGVAGKHYVAWLIPVQKDGAGATVLYNGVGTVPDNMAFVDLGVQ